MAGKRKSVGQTVRMPGGGTIKINAGRSPRNTAARAQLMTRAARAEASAPSGGRTSNAGIGDIYGSLTGVGRTLKGKR